MGTQFPKKLELVDNVDIVLNDGDTFEGCGGIYQGYIKKLLKNITI